MATVIAILLGFLAAALLSWKVSNEESFLNYIKSFFKNAKAPNKRGFFIVLIFALLGSLFGKTFIKMLLK